MSAQPVIKAVGLTKVFRDFWRRARVRAVNDLDFEVEAGEVYGLLGPNGSGKSTAIKMILGLLHPTRGRVSVFGQPPGDVQVKARIGYLPEESYLYRFLNARETLDYYGTLFRLPRGERKRRTEELLEMVGLRSAARRPVGEYSKGMARRIGLAQALINDPELLILDEPTSGLDPIGAKLVKDIIIRLGKVYKKTILLSSHLLADVEEVCNRVTILYGGRVQESGPLTEVLSREDQHQITTERLSEPLLNEILRLIERDGKSATVTVPHDRLEALFLRIVEQARERRLETAGSAPAGDIAHFLGGTEEGRAVLESLVGTEPARPAPAGAEAIPEPQTGEVVDESLLGKLAGEPDSEPGDEPPVAEEPGADQAHGPTLPKRPAPPPAAEVDEDVLNELTGERREREQE